MNRFSAYQEQFVSWENERETYWCGTILYLSHKPSRVEFDSHTQYGEGGEPSIRRENACEASRDLFA